MEKRHIKILLVEDSPADAFLIKDMLKDYPESSGIFVIENVDTLAVACQRIKDNGIDIALLDLGLPDSLGIETLKRLYADCRRMPIVVLTGLADEAAGMEALHEGAQDYLVKGQIDANLLVRAIRYAIERKKIENDRERLIEELKEALGKVKQLSGLLPICSSCKKIRDDKGYWNQLEVYISEHSDAEFSHGLCSECAKKLYPDYFKDKK
jgi:DNA-binding NarL/FixJ family response regulator